jgi:hypothetical protein
MPKRKQLVPFAVGGGADPNIEIKDEIWSELEDALGKDIEPQVRSALIEATNNYLLFATGECAEPIADTKRRINDLKTSAELFLQTLIKEDGSAARLYADHLIAIQFRKPNLYNFTSEMMEFVAACKLAADNSIASTSGSPRPPGWDAWIVKLTTLMEANDLPFEARKDSDKSDRASPFVSFLYNLQRAVVHPAFRRGDHSLATLAGEIGRARAGRIPQQKED